MQLVVDAGALAARVAKVDLRHLILILELSTADDADRIARVREDQPRLGEVPSPAGNCLAVGSYNSNPGRLRPLLVSERNGSWSKSSEPPQPEGTDRNHEGSLRQRLNRRDPRLGQCSGMTPDEALAGRSDAVLKLAFVFGLVVVPL